MVGWWQIYLYKDYTVLEHLMKCDKVKENDYITISKTNFQNRCSEWILEAGRNWIYMLALSLTGFMIWSYLTFKKSIYSCAVSSLLHKLLSSCGVWASHCGGFSCCRTWALVHMGFSSSDMWAQELQLQGSRAQA